RGVYIVNPAGSNPKAGDDAKQGAEGKRKRGAVRAQQVVHIPTEPGTERATESLANADQSKNSAKRGTWEQISGDGAEDWSTGAISQAEENRINVQWPGDGAAGDEHEHENANLGTDYAESHAPEASDTVRENTED